MKLSKRKGLIPKPKKPDKFSPEWYKKHGSWHCRKLLKIENQAKELFWQGLTTEQGWGNSQDSMQELCYRIECLVAQIHYEKTHEKEQVQS